jgi:hypothetical protein
MPEAAALTLSVSELTSIDARLTHLTAHLINSPYSQRVINPTKALFYLHFLPNLSAWHLDGQIFEAASWHSVVTFQKKHLKQYV